MPSPARECHDRYFFLCLAVFTTSRIVALCETTAATGGTGGVGGTGGAATVAQSSQ